MPLEEHDIRRILDAYLAGTATPSEKRIVEQFVEDHKDDVLAEKLNSAEYTLLEQRIQHNIKRRIRFTRKRQNFSWRLAAASVAAIAIMTAAYFFLNNTLRQQEVRTVSTIVRKTGKGQKLTLRLPDGSVVKLNVNSSISFPEIFDGNAREVILSGEGFFDVAHNPAMPFVVTTVNGSTTVLGTTFNVNQRNDITEVTLVSGRVKVLPNMNGNPVELKPNQQALMHEQMTTVDTTSVNVARYIEWKDNVISFDDIPLADAVLKLEDWYGVEIEVENRRLYTCRITARYENESLENVLKSFSFMLKGKYTLQEKKVILSGKGCR